MIRLEKIGKSYDLGEVEVTALTEVSLQIERGEYISVMGPSGSGKSTFMHIVGLLDVPSEGSYFLEDVEITQLPDKEQARIRNRHFGFIFQSFNLFSELSAIENVMLPMGYARMGRGERRTRAAELLEQVGLNDRMYHLPTMMSGGEQQRVAIARSLALKPDLILADEPTGNLPSDRGEEIMAILEGLNQEGVTIVMVTHDEDLGRRARRCIRVRDGRVAQDGEVVAQDGEVNA
jgi:putative ABC transport system ATP-binding protein